MSFNKSSIQALNMLQGVQIDYPILDKRNPVLLLLLLLLLRHAQGTPPGFRNGVDWRALVED